MQYRLPCLYSYKGIKHFDENFAAKTTLILNTVILLLSSNITLHLKDKYGLEPIHLFVSEAHAPNSEAFLPIKSISICDTEDEDVLTFIQILGGTLPELLPNEDIRKPLIHTFRRGKELRILQITVIPSPDVLHNLIPEVCYVLEVKGKAILYVEANPKYRYLMESFITTSSLQSFEKAERNIPFSSVITCFNGSEDKPLIFSAWHDLTSGAISFYRLPGDHFYLLEPSNEIFLTKHITRCIENAGL
ncbi:S-acyl fatty acid synthase thioesterase, medium chain [Aquila chrysaetos chrysaetos]|uniref:S-acyl fatty acid synthase thioesterase, medium chain n=1 Tax=Aquila chrysaetos chrysaetos TaxID=223781 RepID=UPI001B7D34CC|nr:S-acyl fatty acid synthase thioesterase, medium chain [Aquila chrysaetos chrysaetos]